MEKVHVDWLLGELKVLVEKGVVSSEVSTKISDYYKNAESSATPAQSNAVEKEEEDREIGNLLRSPTLRILGLHKASDLLKFKGEDDELDELIEREDKEMNFAENEVDQFLETDGSDANGEAEQAKDLSVYEAEVVDAEKNDLLEEDDLCEEEWEDKLERFLQQGDEAIELLDKAGRDFERSLDTFTDGLEKMFDSIEGMLEVALKR